MGLSQLMPETVKTLRITDPFDPAQNLYGGAQHFAHMLRRFNNTELALAAYNAGPGAVRKYGGIPPYRETQNYVRKVLSHYQKLTEQRNPDPSKTG
jgi:soluble lytic murein transglycosylase-like protein